jgi:hypothetical protein
MKQINIKGESKMKKSFLTVLLLMLVIPTLAMAEHFWVGVFAKGTPYTDQSFISSAKLANFNYAIEKEWENGFDIIDIEYGNDVWMAISAKGTGYRQQVYIHKRDWKKFEAAVAEYKKQGFDLLNVENGKGYWLGILVKGSKYTDVTLKNIRYWDEFQKEIRKQWKAGYHLLDVEPAEGTWIGIFAKNTGFTAQSDGDRKKMERRIHSPKHRIRRREMVLSLCERCQKTRRVIHK